MLFGCTNSFVSNANHVCVLLAADERRTNGLNENLNRCDKCFQADEKKKTKKKNIDKYLEMN